MKRAGKGEEARDGGGGLIFRKTKGGREGGRRPADEMNRKFQRELSCAAASKINLGPLERMNNSKIHRNFGV